MPLTPKRRHQLKSKAHHLKPIVIIGNKGLTLTVNEEIENALMTHELFKMKINLEDRNLRRNLFAEICQLHQAELVQQVGKIGVLYRRNLTE